MTRFVHRRWAARHATSVLAAAYVALALLLGLAGDAFGWRIFGQDAARLSSTSAVSMLAAISAGMLAFTAIVFSMVLVAFQTGMSSYSPRMVGVFGRSHFTGHAFGIFTGTFLYALLAIRTVDASGSPGINFSVVATAFAWLLASVGALLLLLPRLGGLSIARVLAGLYRDTAAAATRVYAPAQGRVTRAHGVPALAVTKVIRYSGPPRYVTGFDVAALVSQAAHADAVLVVSPATGDAVVTGDLLVSVLGGTHSIAESAVRQAVWLEPERSVDNDPAWGIRLLVDIAIRALSPAVNDPTTAVSVLDELDGLLRLLGRQHLEEDSLFDSNGSLRVVREVPSWDDLVGLALSEIHQYGRDSFQVQRRLAVLLNDLCETLPESRRPTLRRFMRWRAASTAEVLHAPETWPSADAGDRQGLGHERSPIV